MSSILKVSSIQDPTNSNTALSVDASGRVTTPARPAFFAYLTSTQSLNSASDIDITQYLTSTDFNIGGHYSSTNGFEAPIDGIYYFQFGFYTYSVSYSELIVYKNGAKFQRLSNANVTNAVNPFSAQSSSLIQLSSGDEIKVYHSPVTASLYSGDRNTFFSGYLVG